MQESEEQIKVQIQQLHNYNEIKDIAQVLLGKLAEATGRTIANVYADFELEITD